MLENPFRLIKTITFLQFKLDVVVNTIDLMVREKRTGVTTRIRAKTLSYYDYALKSGKSMGVDLSLIGGVDAKLDFKYCKYSSLEN